MRSLHPKPYSRFDNRVEQVAEGFNQGCAILLWLAFFTALFMCYAPGKKTHHATYDDSPREVSELQYMQAIASAKIKPLKLNEEQMQEMDRLASMATNPDDVARLKPKAKARYYASLNNKTASPWSAVDGE